MNHPALQQENNVARILKYIDNIWDLRNVIDASPILENIIDKYELKNKVQNGTCWGCWEDQPNQLAHMDIGGCLWTDSMELDNPLSPISLNETTIEMSEEENIEPPHNIAYCECHKCTESRAFQSWISYRNPSSDYYSTGFSYACECVQCRGVF